MKETGKRANQGVFVGNYLLRNEFQYRTLRRSAAMGGWIHLTPAFLSLINRLGLALSSALQLKPRFPRARTTFESGGRTSLNRTMEDGRIFVRAARGDRSLRRLQKLYPFYSVRSSLV